MAGAPFLQADAAVDAEAGIHAVIDGDLEIGAGLVTVYLLGRDGETEGELVAALVIQGAIEGDGDLPLDVAARLAGVEFGFQHLDPVAVGILVIAGQQAIAAEFEAEHMAVAAEPAAVQAGERRCLIGKGKGVCQQGIGLVADHELALTHHGALLGEAVFRERDGGYGEVRRRTVHQLDGEIGTHQIPVAVAVFEGERQALAVLAVIQALLPEDAIAAVIGQCQGEDGDPPRARGQGLAVYLVAEGSALAGEAELLEGALIGAEAHLQVAIQARPRVQGAGGAHRALGQIRLGQGQGIALADEGRAIDHPVPREIRHLGAHLEGALNVGEIQAIELPATIAPHQGGAAVEGLAVLADEGDGDALARLHLSGAAAQGDIALAQQALGVEIVDVDAGTGVNGDGQGVAGSVAGDVHGIDTKIIGAIGHVTGDLVLPVAVAIHGEHGQNVSAEAQGDGGTGLSLALQERRGVAGQIVHLAGAGVALVGQVQRDGGDGVEQGLTGVAGPVAGRILGICLYGQGAVHQLAGDVAEVRLPDEAGQHHSGGGQAIAVLVYQGNGDGLADLHILDKAANDDAGRLVGVDDVVVGLGLGDGDGRQEILIFRIEQFIPWLGALMIGVKARLRQGIFAVEIHHHEAAGAGADHTATRGGCRVTGRGLLEQLGRVGPLTDGILQAGQLGIHG